MSRKGPDPSERNVVLVRVQHENTRLRSWPGAPSLAGFESPAPLQARLGEEACASSADLRRASGLLERTFDYLSRGSGGSPL